MNYNNHQLLRDLKHILSDQGSRYEPDPRAEPTYTIIIRDGVPYQVIAVPLRERIIDPPAWLKRTP